MSNLPSLRPIDVVRNLRKSGFVFDRHAKGSHEIWYNPRTRYRTVFPNNPGRDVPRGTLRAIIEQAGLTVNEFINL